MSGCATRCDYNFQEITLDAQLAPAADVDAPADASDAVAAVSAELFTQRDVRLAVPNSGTRVRAFAIAICSATRSPSRCGLIDRTERRPPLGCRLVFDVASWLTRPPLPRWRTRTKSTRENNEDKYEER